MYGGLSDTALILTFIGSVRSALSGSRVSIGTISSGCQVDKTSSSLIFMSGTDEELNFAHENGMDHVTYLLIMFRSEPALPLLLSTTQTSLLVLRYSITFIVYTLTLSLIWLSTTSGRNAGGARGDGIEMTKWYSRVPNTEEAPRHVIGDDEDS
jgi:hypothetical protein